MPPPFQRDPAFWVALAAGVLFWIVLLAFGRRPSELGTLWSFATLSSVIAQPILEEVFFRGLLQSALRDSIGTHTRLGISAANALTTIAFVLAHLRGHPPLWALSVAAPSLVFGYMRDRHANIWPGVALHVIYNAGFFALSG